MDVYLQMPAPQVVAMDNMLKREGTRQPFIQQSQSRTVLARCRTNVDNQPELHVSPAKVILASRFHDAVRHDTTHPVPAEFLIQVHLDT